MLFEAEFPAERAPSETQGKQMVSGSHLSTSRVSETTCGNLVFPNGFVTHAKPLGNKWFTPDLQKRLGTNVI